MHYLYMNKNVSHIDRLPFCSDSDGQNGCVAKRDYIRIFKACLLWHAAVHSKFLIMWCYS